MSVESTVNGIKASLSKILSKNNNGSSNSNNNNHNHIHHELKLSPEDVDRCRDMFQQLNDCNNITLEILTNTLIGTIVTKFIKRRHNDEIGGIAKSLIKKWKQIVKKEGENSNNNIDTGREEENNVHHHPHNQPPTRNMTILEQLEEALKNNSIPHTKHTDPRGIMESLEEFGVSLVPLPSDSFDWETLKCKSGQLLKETFPNLTTTTKTKLQQEGDIQSFNEEWKTGKVQDHNIMLYSAGMPTPITLSSEVAQLHQDPISGLIFRYNPLAAKCPSLVWSFLPRDIFPEGAFVTSDGMKTIAGGKQTPIHYDGDAATLLLKEEEEGNSNNEEEETDVDNNNEKKKKYYSRVQCILIGDDPNAKRHLYFVANTPLIHSLLAQATKTDPSKMKERGFRSLKHPQVEELLRKYSNTVRPGLVLMKSGTFHMEKSNSDFTSNNNNKSGNTLRYYCGYIPYAKEQLLQEQQGDDDGSLKFLIRIAFLRCNGYAMDTYSLKVNRKSILFTNDKTTQYRQVQLTNPDENLYLNLYQTSHNDMCEYLKHNLTKDELALYGLKPEDLLLFGGGGGTTGGGE